MSILTRLAFIFLLYFAVNIRNTGGSIVYMKHWSFPKTFDVSFHPRRDSISGHNAHNYTKFTYSVCDPSTWKDMTEMKCTIVQDTEPKRSCSVETLKAKDRASPYYILPFNSTKSLIVWADHYILGLEYHRVSVLDFTTCHQSKELFLKRDTFLSIGNIIGFIAYGDSFDLVLHCRQPNEYCKYNINDKGEIVSKLDPWFTSDEFVLNVYGIVKESKLKAYMHIACRTTKQYSQEDEIMTYRIMLTQTDGSSKLLMEPQLKYERSAALPSWIFYAASTTHEIISYALNNGTHINIWKFDQEGNLKLNTSMRYKLNLERLTIYNLADGGFLLLTVNCDKNCDNKEGSRKYDLIKFAANGKVIGSVENAGAEFNCYGSSTDISLQIFQNKENEYCIAVECRDNVDENRSNVETDLLMKCFTDTDFSVNRTLF